MPAAVAPTALLACPIHHRDCPSPPQASSSPSDGICHPVSCPLFLAAIIVITCTVNQAARWILLRGRGVTPATNPVEQRQSVRLEHGLLTGSSADRDDQKSTRTKNAGELRGRYLRKCLKFSCCQIRQSRRRRPASTNAVSVSPGIGAIPSKNAGGGASTPPQSVADAELTPGFSNPPRAISGSVVRLGCPPDRRSGRRLGHQKQIVRTFCDRIIRRICCCFRRSRTTRRAAGFHEPRVVRELREVEVVKGRVRRVAGANDVTIIPFETGGETAEAQQRFLRRGLLGVSGSARNLMGTGARGDEVVVDEKWDAAVELTLRRFVYSTAGGAVAALTLFRSPTTRWSAIAFGAGIGLGSALMDSSYILNNSSSTRPYSTR